MTFFRSSCLWVAPVALAALAAVAGPVQAAVQAGLDPQTRQITVSSQEEALALVLTAAKTLIEQKRWDDAAHLMAQSEAAFPDSSQVLFLAGLVELNRENYQAAQSIFRRLLLREPDAARVRLELARSFFLAGDDENARYQFRLALAGDLPPAVVANVERYLQAIRKRRNWDFGVSLGIAPDSNVNAAPSLGEISIFGLPFTLDEESQRTSGLGFFATMSGEYREPFSAQWQGRMGARLHRNEYEGSQFDDMTLSGFAGPRLLIGPWDVSLLATGYRRWYGNTPYSDAAGARLEAERRFTRRLSGRGSVQWVAIDYADSDTKDGSIASLSFIGTYALSSASFLRGLVLGSIESTAHEANANRALGAGIGYYRDLPMGFSIYVQPQAEFTWYDAESAAFGTRREDWFWQVRTNILNRNLDLHGFTPLLGYVFQRQISSIDLYSYTRNRFEIGVTRQF